MEGSVRSGGGVLKKKQSSSGCLIINKKGGGSNFDGGLGGLSDKKKRVRLVASSSSSSSSDEDESLEFMRRKVKGQGGGNKRSELESRDYERGIEINGDRKRSRLDLFEFDEYDEFDENKMRNEYLKGKLKMTAGQNGGSGKLKVYSGGLSSRNFVVDKRKKGSYMDGSCGGRSKGLEEDESNMPISLLKLKYQENADEPIRLQGKNGVLKVMVNKKKKMGFPALSKNHEMRDLKERKGSRSNDVARDLSAELPIYPTSKTPKKRELFLEREKSAEKEKKDIKVNSFPNKGMKAKDSEVDGTDTELKLAQPIQEVSSSKKRMKEEERSPNPPENSTPVKSKEVKDGNAKRGGSTEKQMLREKIRGMLVDAGWTIDLRPRRNRDYLDSVYINPSGIAYWSIVKAYDAFKNQLDEDDSKIKENVCSPSSAPLSEELINKLTRQTKKKIEREMKRKRKENGATKSAKNSAVRETEESLDSDENEERLSFYMKQKHKSWRGKNRNADQYSDGDLINDSPKRKPRSEKPSNASKSYGRTSKVIGRCTLLVRGSDKGEYSDSDEYVPYSGKRTVLAWLIDSGMAHLRDKVQYMNRKKTRVMLEGWITRDGIHCGCCSKILSVSKFELHAGSKLRQPFQNVFLESGYSLLQCQIDAWNKQEESLRRGFHSVDVDGDDPDDDTCGICGDGGDLICCDSCPSTFHQTCLEIQMLPSGDWHCPYCTCKFCGHASENIAKDNDKAGDELNRCSFCEKKYHKSCSERVQALPLSSSGASFCGLKCEELYEHLQKILGIKHELEGGFSWSLIQRTDISDASQRGFPQRVECNSKLAVALSVMNECFLPIIDRRSGINLIHSVVYNCGSNFNRLNYSRFYVVILERGDEIISAASIRLHGARLAEMPFIGTRDMYRRQGMCRRLFSAIKTELCSLKVEQLIIPAISEHMNTWTAVFGFDELKDVHKKEIKSMNILVFPGTDMLQKQLVKQESSDDAEVSEPTTNQPQLHVSVEKPDIDSSLEQNRQTSSNSGGSLESKNNDGIHDLDSGSPAPSIPLKAIGESENKAAIASDAIGESDSKTAIASDAIGESDNKATIASDAICESDSKTAIASDAIGESDNKATIASDAICESDSKTAVASDAIGEYENKAAIASDDICESDSKTAIASDAIGESDNKATIAWDAICESENKATIASDAICESDIPLASLATTSITPEEMKQDESTPKLNCSSASDMEHRLPNPPTVNISNSSVKASVVPPCLDSPGETPNLVNLMEKRR